MSNLSSLLAQFKTVPFASTQPAYVPSDWIIFNGLRPLFGSLSRNGGGLRWRQHHGPDGSHWAAVNPADRQALAWTKENLRLQAVIVEFQPR